MNKKILALLEAKFPGVRKDVLENLASSIALQADTEEEATEIVGKMTAEKVTKYGQDYRSSIDREVQQANKTYEENLRKKYDFAEKQQQQQQQQQQTGGLTLDQVRALFSEQLKPLSDRLDAVDRQKTAAARRETYVGKLKAAKLSDSTIEMMAGQFDRMSFKDDEDFNTFLTSSQPTIDKLAQQAADEALRRSPAAQFGKTTTEGVSESVNAYIQSKQQKENSLGGKSI